MEGMGSLKDMAIKDQEGMSSEKRIVSKVNFEENMLNKVSESGDNTRSDIIVINGLSYEINEWIKLTKKEIKKPFELMRHALETLLKSKNLWSDDLASDIPKNWVKHGEMILFCSKSFHHPIWKIKGDMVWPVVCTCLNAEKLGRKHAIQPDGFRSPKIEMLWGNNSWITCVDNKISYSWDVMKCMFSPGNATERHRISKMKCQGETVVDLYSGIGYFTLPFLVHAKASFVHACEWNPAAVEVLRLNLENNGVMDRCLIYEGDNRVVGPSNVADRVVMGLIPSCEQGIIPACKALKSQSGGILHMHENVSSFTKLSESGQPLCTPIFNIEFWKLGNDFCGDCFPIISILRSADALTEDSLVNNSEQIMLKNSPQINLIWDEDCCKPVWSKKSQIVWKKLEWFIQAVHFSHKVCTFISKYHQRPWEVEVIGYHHVKSYAPHIDHLVFDIKVCPTTSLSRNKIHE